MKHRRPLHSVLGVAAAVGALLLGCGAAVAQTQLIDRVGSVFDDVARGLNRVGEKAQDLLGPGLGFGAGDAGGFVESREFEERYPVVQGARVSVSNEFGEIRVTTWDNPVVEVTAKISVRAESAELASQIVQNTAIQTAYDDRAVEVRTVLPDTRGGSGKPTIEVNYAITLPRDAALNAKNDFGDTLVAGVGGAVSIDARYGAVDLRDISGSVNCRARGEFVFAAHGLRQGGVFELYGARADFRNVAGVLRVGSFRGAVELRDLAPEVDVDVVNESGPITYYVGEQDAPEISVTVLFGECQSDVPLNWTAQGDFTVARSFNPDAKQRVALRTSFSNVVIRRQGAEPSPEPVLNGGGQPFKEVTTPPPQPVPENAQMTIEAMPGDVRITGTDENLVRITATKLVRVQSQSNVRAALQALDLRVNATETTLSVRTALTDNMAALGCTSYRVDLAIECPRTISVGIQAQDGHTLVSGIGGATSVIQAMGSVAIEHVKGEATLSNKKGDVLVTECAGPVTVTASYGAISLNNVYGKMSTTCTQGKTVIEAPHGEIFARSVGGDIRILSLEGVNGNYDVRAEQGNISILLPPATDASLAVTAENGAVHSAIPLTGNINKDFQEFVKANTGPSRVTLQTKGGDIIIN